MKLARQVMMKGTGTEMWSELVSIYEGKTNPDMTAQKVYSLQGELHRTHLRGNGNVRSHLPSFLILEINLRIQAFP